MSGITIHDLGNTLEQRLRVRAKENGRTLEEEALEILRVGIEGHTVREIKLGTALHQLFKPFSELELEIPEREPMREPPRMR